MSRVNLLFAAAAALFFGLVGATVGPIATPVHAQDKAAQLQVGKEVYEKNCQKCHGATGKGDGPDAVKLGFHPRDYTLGAYKCRCTGEGQPPADEDLMRTVTRGMPGTPMLAFEKLLTPDQRAAVVQYIKTLSPAFKSGNAASCPAPPVAPASSPELLAEGKEMYTKMGCGQCHGASGRGDGPSAASLKDAWGNPIKPYNFVVMKRFKCGGDPQDLYRTLQVGLAGTPMPSYRDALAADAPATLSPKQKTDLIDRRTWAMVQYVLSLSGGK